MNCSGASLTIRGGCRRSGTGGTQNRFDVGRYRVWHPTKGGNQGSPRSASAVLRVGPEVRERLIFGAPFLVSGCLTLRAPFFPRPGVSWKTNLLGCPNAVFASCDLILSPPLLGSMHSVLLGGRDTQLGLGVGALVKAFRLAKNVQKCNTLI